jgi:MFS family permease
VSWVFAARFMDRVGKGLRGAPRDALIVELTTPGLRGAAFGLRQALDTVGAVLGPLLAVGLMILFASDIRMAMWFGVVPAIIAVLVLLVFVHEPQHRSGRAASAADGGARKKRMLAGARRLPLRFWMVVALGAVFTLARFSEAFLVLRAHSVGLALSYVPLVMIVMNVLYATAAFPAGAAADRVSARTLLLFGLALLIAADFVLAFASSPLLVFAGAALWGLHMALTQGLLSKLVADAAPAELLGTAFGIFHLVSGVAMLLASVIAGALWHAIGAGATFLAGAAFAGLAAIGLLVVARR